AEGAGGVKPKAPHPQPLSQRREGEQSRADFMRREKEYKDRLPEYLLKLIREFRTNPTDAEAMLWECLRARRLNGFKFRRQHPNRRYVVDFYCHEARLIVEVDGDIHDVPDQQEYDVIRQQEL